MPGAYELLGLVIVVVIAVVVLKVMRLAIKLFVLLCAFLAIGAAVAWAFMR